MVIAPAKTGKASNKSTVVIKTDQTNSGIWSIIIPKARMFKIVLIKFIAPKIEEIPAKCNEKIAQSTEGPAWAIFLLKGG
jgi:hypothetical protein